MSSDFQHWNKLKQSFAFINEPLANLYDKISSFKPEYVESSPLNIRKKPNFNIIIKDDPLPYSEEKLKKLFLEIVDCKNIYKKHPSSMKSEFAETYQTLDMLYSRASDCYIMPFTNPNNPENFLESILEKFKSSINLICEKPKPTKSEPKPDSCEISVIEPPSPLVKPFGISKIEPPTPETMKPCEISVIEPPSPLVKPFAISKIEPPTPETMKPCEISAIEPPAYVSKPIIIRKIEPPSPAAPSIFQISKIEPPSPPISKSVVIKKIEPPYVKNVPMPRLTNPTLNKVQSPPQSSFNSSSRTMKYNPMVLQREEFQFGQIFEMNQTKTVNVSVNSNINIGKTEVVKPQEPIKFSFLPKGETNPINLAENQKNQENISPYLKYNPKKCLDFLQSVQKCLKITHDKPYVVQAKRELKIKVNQISVNDPTQYTKDIISIFQNFIGKAVGQEKETVAYHLWIVLLDKLSDQFSNQFYHQVNSAISSGQVIKELLMVYPDKELFLLSLLSKHCPLIFEFSSKTEEDKNIIDEFVEACDEDEDMLASLKGLARLLAGICILPNKNPSFSLILSLSFLPVIIGGLMNRFHPCYSAEIITGILDVAQHHLVGAYKSYGVKLLRSIQNFIESDSKLKCQTSETNLVSTIRVLLKEHCV